MRKEMCNPINLNYPEVVGNPNQPASDISILKSQMVALEIENLKLKSRLDAIENLLVELIRNVEFVAEK